MTFQISLEEGKFLVELARRAVEEYLKTKERIKVPENTLQKLLKPCGVFVTINSVEYDEEKLRGCIGYPYPSTPLAEAVIEAAINSATQDPRFPRLSPTELENVIFEVSVLTPPQMIEVENPEEYPSKIEIGKDGLIIEKGLNKGLLLPQVPVECRWDGEEFLCHCGIKAGLSPDCWLLKSTKVHKFQAMVFKEEKPEGEIKRRKPEQGKST